jgi:hypothetical protein
MKNSFKSFKPALTRRDRQDIAMQMARYESECGPCITVRPAVTKQTPVFTNASAPVSSVHQIAQSFAFVN